MASKKQKLGTPNEIGNYGDFAIYRKLIVTENGEQREFHLPDGTPVGRVMRRGIDGSPRGQPPLLRDTLSTLQAKYSQNQLNELAEMIRRS